MSGFNAVLARNTADAPEGVGPYSQTVAFSHYNNLAAQLPIDPATGELVVGGVTEQAAQCLNNIRAVVESIDHVLDDVVRLTVFVTDIGALSAVDEVFESFFPHYKPTRTNVAVADLPKGAAVQIEALVSNGEGTIPDAPQAGDLVKVARNTPNAPQSPVSTQTVAFSHYNNLTAQLPIDPATGDPVIGDVTAQAEQCFANIKAILESIDHVMDDIVRITIFLTDLADKEPVEQVYASFFPGYRPALTVVNASALQLGARVQVEAVVSHGDGTPPQPPEDAANIVIWARNTDNAPQSPLSTQTVAFSHYNHISAQLPLDAAGEQLPGGIAEQTAQCLDNIKAIVESIDHSLADTVKVNIALTDLGNIAAVDEVYSRYFPEGTPARRTIGVDSLPGDALIQIDAVIGNAEGTPPSA